MKGKLIIKILESKKKEMPEEGYESGTEESEGEERYEFSEKDVAAAQLRVASETLSGKDLVEFVDQYRDLLMKDEAINPFE